MAQNNGKVIEWHDLPPSGFFYVDTSGYQKFLKTKNTGFVEPDNRKLIANAGLIDWTNGTDLISWKGLRRYDVQALSSGFGSQIYKKNHEFDFTAQLSGALICGAAFKTKVFLVFALTSAKELRYFFIKDNVILASDSLGSYESLQQIVAVSADCTKAAFIAVPTGQDKKQTAVIDLIISFADKTVTIDSTVIQDVEDHTSYVANSSYSRAETTIVIAVDFNLSNIRKEFFIKNTFAFKFLTGTTDYIDTGEVFDGISWLPTRDAIYNTSNINFDGTINYNNQLTISQNYHDVSQVIYHEIFFGEWSEVTPIVRESFFSHNIDFNYIFIHWLDLRYGVFCYTKNQDASIDNALTFTITRDFKLEIATFSTEFKAQSASDIYPFYGNIFYKTVSSHSFLTVPIQYNPYNLNLATDNALINSTASIGLTDKFANKLAKIQTASIDDVVNSISTAPILLKIDYTNSIKTNTITDLKGVV